MGPGTECPKCAKRALAESGAPLDPLRHSVMQWGKRLACHCKPEAQIRPPTEAYARIYARKGITEGRDKRSPGRLKEPAAELRAAHRLMGLSTSLSAWYVEGLKLLSKGFWTTRKSRKKHWKLPDFLLNKVCQDEEHEVIFFLELVKQVISFSEISFELINIYLTTVNLNKTRNHF